MDCKINEALESQSTEIVSINKIEELSELQLLLVGGGSGDVIFA